MFSRINMHTRRIILTTNEVWIHSNNFLSNKTTVIKKVPTYNKMTTNNSTLMTAAPVLVKFGRY